MYPSRGAAFHRRRFSYLYKKFAETFYQIDHMKSKKPYVVPLSQIRGHLGKSKQAKYIFNYLDSNDVKAKTGVIEENYIDKDYLLDYAGFYSRSFESYARHTKRIHFFSKSFDQEYFENLLVSREKTRDKRLGKYLGFVVIKLFRNSNSKSDPLIGRTLLTPYFEKIRRTTLGSNPDTRHFISSEYHPNLYGLDLRIKSLPFQAQDNAVSACATSCLWIANSQLSNIFDTPKLSPIEVTNKATRFVGDSRSLPNSGLTLKQMLDFLTGINLDFEYFSPHATRQEFPTDLADITKFIPDTVKAFIDAGIPIIAGLTLKKYVDEPNGKEAIGKEDRDIEKADDHAVVICGYRENHDGNVNTLYVHDDQIGPYSKVKSASDGQLF